MPLTPDATTSIDAAPVEPIEDGYLPRSALSSFATPQGPVLLIYPEDHAGDPRTRTRAVISLFIDESGVVQRIRVEHPGLPEALEAAVRLAFAPVKFTPGEVDGQPVPSLMRVEVSFDIDEPPAAQ